MHAEMLFFLRDLDLEYVGQNVKSLCSQKDKHRVNKKTAWKSQLEERNFLNLGV